MEKTTGLFVGLVSVPYKTGISDAREYFELIFSTYLDRINGIAKDSLHSCYFKPKFYHLFGHHDLAIISFVDDFVFGQQKFKPFSETAFCTRSATAPATPKIPLFNFNYQVTNCSVEVDLDTAIQAPEPIILISQFKIKNSLLIGSSTETIGHITDKVKEVLDKKIASGKSNGCIRYKIAKTRGWHELLLLFYGDDPKAITDMFLTVREMSIHTSEFPESYAFKAEPTAEYPLFSFTYSYFGLSCDLDTTDLEKYGKEMNLFTKYFVRPGQMAKLEDPSKSFIIGNGDIAIEPTNSTMLLMNKTDASFDAVLRKTRSLPRVQITETYSSGSLTGSFPIEKITDEFGIKDTNVQSADQILSKLKIEKAIRIRVLKTIINYHDALCDPAIYIYVIELGPIIRSLISYLADLEKKYVRDRRIDMITHPSASYALPPLNTIHEELNRRTNIFERAYRCRMQHSLRTIDLTDSTLEYSGGLQQIISAYDNLFKLFRAYLSYYEDVYQATYVATAYVTTRSGINSDKLSLQVNYMYLAQPEFFISTVFKESLNHLLTVRRNSLNNVHDGKRLELHDAYLFYRDEYKDRVTGNGSNSFKENAERYRQFIVLCDIHPEPIIRKIVNTIANEIQRLPINRELRWDFLEYTTLINKALFDYLTYDYYNFKHYYQENHESYFFWLWNMFFQERMHYETDGLLKADFFLRLLFRSRHTIFSIEDETTRKSAQDYLSSIINGYPLAKDIYETVHESFEQYFTFITTVNDEKRPTNSGIKVINSIFHFSFIKDFNLDQDHLVLLGGFTRLTPKYERFKKVRDKLHEFLDAIKTDCVSKRPFNNILHRCIEGGTVDTTKGKFIDDVFFDSGGGLFLTGSQRQKYFMHREHLLDYLNDLGCQMKKWLADAKFHDSEEWLINDQISTNE